MEEIVKIRRLMNLHNKYGIMGILVVVFLKGLSNLLLSNFFRNNYGWQLPYAKSGCRIICIGSGKSNMNQRKKKYNTKVAEDIYPLV